jgi:AraC-like DNA-binding protein
MDPLSDVLSLLKVESVLSARFEASGSWVLRFPAYRHLKFGDMLEGSRWVWIDQVTEPVKVGPGDFYLLTDGRPYCLASDLEAKVVDFPEVLAGSLGDDRIVRYGRGGTRTVGTGGRFTFDDETSRLLLDALPAFIHIRADSPHAAALRSVRDLIGFETEMVRPGGAAVAGSLANIVLVNILRAYLAEESRPMGWLGALTDAHIGPTLGMMHAEIARRWKVEDLAAEAGMSRTAFAERFKALVGVPPLEYLIRWRMTIARNALKADNEGLATIAAGIGYASETAFSSAFKNMFGVSPGQYRTQVRRER